MDYIEVATADWVSTLQACLNGEEKQLTALFANDERPITGGLAVYALVLDKTNQQLQGIKTILMNASFEIPSLVPVTPAAAWYEREMHDLFGIVPVGHPDIRPLVLHENWPDGVYPLRKDFDPSTPVIMDERKIPVPTVAGEGIFEVPVGPIHAGIIEPGHFRFSQAGEHIINLEARLFYTHRGIEKAVEGLPVDKAFYQVERICGACSVSHALSYSQALERLAEVKVPSQAQVFRVIAAELERLYNHVGDTGNLCAGLGFAMGISHGARLKEKFMRLNERVAGNRFLRGIVVPGGVRLPLTFALRKDILQILTEVEQEYHELSAILRDNDAFLDRINTTGVVPRQAAVDLALVGVGARASGVQADVRRDLTYAVYGQLDFKIPVYSDGDVAARLWVRVDEVAQSIEIIRQAFTLPMTGNWSVPLPALPEYHTAAGWSESPRGSNIHWVMTGKNNTVYRLFVRSASYPNWPALTIAAPGNIIPDFPLINKSFELCYACIDR